jgi:NADH-quinone oxidoreductase subunit M
MEAFFTSHLLSIIVAAPFVAAVLLLLVDDDARLTIRWISLLGALTSLAGSIHLATRYVTSQGGLQFAERYPLVPSHGIELSLAADGWSVSLLLLTGIIIVTGVMASWTVSHRSREFFILLLVLVAGVFGVFVSQDLFVFFLFYEIAVLPMYLLISTKSPCCRCTCSSASGAAGARWSRRGRSPSCGSASTSAGASTRR